MSCMYFFLIGILLFLCCLLSFVILIQESKTTGLGASFGGDTGDSLFGVQTPQVLKVFTAYTAGVFLIFCVVLSFWTSARCRCGLSQEVVSEMTESKESST